MNTKDHNVIIGKIGAPFGVKGWVKVHSFTDPATNITDYKIWILKDNKNYNVEQIKQHGKIFIAKLESVDDKDQAHLLTNLEIAVKRSSFKDLPEGEYYWDDLIGMQVFNDNGQMLGKITELFNSGASDIIVVKGDNAEHLIPFITDKHILNVDKTANKIVVHWEIEE